MPDTSRPVFEGRLVNLSIDSVTLPNGVAAELEIVHHPGGAAVVALDEHDKVCLLWQYRHAGGGWLWELPAGKLDPGEAPDTTALRELEEEAGIRAGRLDRLGSMITTPGFCNEIVHLFLARDLVRVPAAPEEQELFEVHWLPFEVALGQVYDGTIRDAKTMLGLTLCANRL
ncbi:MAG TPA: NUDIX hydrolase [Gammaproteobacteria bacterium]|nr:NUDIX hydrolase [Gammaproteobacteria bacterium]